MACLKQQNQTLQTQVQELMASSTRLQAEVQQLQAAVAKLETSATGWDTGAEWAAHWKKEWLSLNESFNDIWETRTDRSDLLARLNHSSHEDTLMILDIVNSNPINGRSVQWRPHAGL